MEEGIKGGEMMDYKIVDTPEFPMYTTSAKWWPLLVSLEKDKSLLFEFDNKRKAQLRAINICGAIRSCRQRKKGVFFKIGYRIIPEDGRFKLYVFKKKESDAN